MCSKNVFLRFAQLPIVLIAQRAKTTFRMSLFDLDVGGYRVFRGGYRECIVFGGVYRVFRRGYRVFRGGYRECIVFGGV